MLPMTLVHDSPPSRDTCRLPSSVPIHSTPGRDGDSRTCVTKDIDEYPSFFSAIGLSPAMPMIDISGAKRFTFLLRSVGFIHHESPRFVDLKKYWAAM